MMKGLWVSSSPGGACTGWNRLQEGVGATPGEDAEGVAGLTRSTLPYALNP